MPQRRDKKYVETAFLAAGYIWLSGEYRNNKSLLQLKCPAGHMIKLRWNDFQQGHRCAGCAGLGRVDVPEFVETVGKLGYIVVDMSGFRNNKSPMLLECPQGHSWRTSTSVFCKGHRCPVCAGNTVSEKNRLPRVFPSLVEEWDYEKNEPLTPDEVAFGSIIKVWWKCSRCSHQWKVSPNSRTSGSHGCPRCSKGRVSKVSQEWLDFLEIPIETRETSIRVGTKKLWVDAYVPETNTVYEFLGDMWHGNPLVFGEGLNPFNKKPYKQLYETTLQRLADIQQSGYSLTYIWETDWRKQLAERLYNARNR